MRISSALFSAALVAVSLAGCAQATPPVSDKVQAFYESNKALAAATPAAKAKTAAFVGDSYTAGGGATDPSRRWTTLAAGQLNWVEQNVAIAGTGYFQFASPKSCTGPCPVYADEVAKAVALNPDIIVIAGGQNDFGAYAQQPENVIAAVNAVYAAARAGAPNRQIIAVGPSTPGEISESALGMDRTVQEAAAAVGAKYISLLAPNVIPASSVLPDKTHVNDAGHAAIAERVSSALR